MIDAVFLLVGLLALSGLLTPVAAGARRASTSAAVVRIIGAVVVAAGLVSLGIAVQGPLGLLQASWFGAMGRTWGPDPYADQARAGTVLVASGVAVVVLVVVVVLVRLLRDRAATDAEVGASVPSIVHDGAAGSNLGADVAPGDRVVRRRDRGSTSSRVADPEDDFDDVSDDGEADRAGHADEAGAEARATRASRSSSDHGADAP